ncbi:hypothetical protein I4U23_010587 [Adineta vaga]|nr:hypothetical protein I4U23_010587 [Adineta vaga]
MNVDFFSAFVGIVFGIMSFSLFLQWNRKQQPVPSHEHIHWNPLIERRGLGDLITRLNHITITVSDVGKSLSFYVDILGLQQIRRPNFDRHGAWLTMGNVELHLIKGIPVVPSACNLQVGHLALETSNIDVVLEKLRALNIDVYQNLSLTNAHKMIEKNKPLIIQYFFNDPDGYYIELCNCEVLIEFAFSQKLFSKNIEYDEGIHNHSIFTVVQGCLHWMKNIEKDSKKELNYLLKNTIRTNEVDETKFSNILKRREIYGDLIQSCSDEDIREALLQSNNFIPLTIKILNEKYGHRKVYQPYPFMKNGKIICPKPFLIE